MTTPLTLLRSTAPHAGLAALSAELWAAYEALPKAQRLALAHRDSYPFSAEGPLEVALALNLVDGRSWPAAMKAAREALRETRGILSPDGNVTR